ncbi:MAG TPA: hypothetical protein H9854_09070 [Candidatus Halomonas stercoripullorum]|uniref:DUF5666 domain-containing protein n=1 Tax=Candidatus Halomonas stercoripullorum TaxID=2838617 RepID=A0A9D1WP27_9GAMM|nr:hypothetical protein [Candidatus Halomonas stercoripullorum]
MLKRFTLVTSALLLTFAGAAHADDIEGEVESVDSDNQTLTVQGITFHTDDNTDYDDGLTSFDDLETGQRVEIDFDYDGERHLATEIELDD